MRIYLPNVLHAKSDYKIKSVQRRRALQSLLLSPVLLCVNRAVQAHTPYGQWQVYRKKHLLIGCHKDDPETYALAKDLVASLETHLPAARARVARAPNAQRLASLLGSGQLDTAIVSDQDARNMASGSSKFKPYGKIDLRSLHLLPAHTLIGNAQIPERHAWLIASSLHEIRSKSPSREPPILWHAGVTRYLSGQVEPKE